MGSLKTSWIVTNLEVALCMNQESSVLFVLLTKVTSSPSYKSERLSISFILIGK